MQEIICTGKTVQDAVQSAREQLGASGDDIVYEILEDAHSGFLGLGSKPAKVKAWMREDEFSGKSLLEELDRPKTPQPQPKPQQTAAAQPQAKPQNNAPAAPKKENNKPRQNNQPKPAPIELPEEPQVEIPLDELPGSAKEALEYLRGIAGLMGATRLTYGALKTEKGVKLIADGEDASLLIGRRGETMDSIQYLCTLISSRTDDDYCKISLDVAGYRGKREKTLIALAQREAAKVKKSKYSSTLEPMNPYERRIVHSAVQLIEGVKSESTGTEPNRRVVISLESGGKQGYDRSRGRGGGHGGHGGGGYRKPYDRSPREGGEKRADAPSEKPASAPKPAPKKDQPQSSAGKTLYGRIDI